MGCIDQSVLDFNSTKQRRALYHQPLGWAALIDGIVLRLTDITAEDANALHRHTPTDRDNDFATAEEYVGINHGFVTLNVRLREIDLEAAKDCDNLAPTKVPSIDLALGAAKDCVGTQRVIAWREGA
jgi:hypothetical protein